MQKIGIIGGTFNPPHIGHLIIAEHFVNYCNLDKCIFIPANLSPFKTEDDAAKSIAPKSRADMVKLAIQGNEKFEIDTFEIDKRGVSRSIDTIRYLENKYPGDSLYMLIGEDQAKDFKKWASYRDILEKAYLCIADRTEFLAHGEKKHILDELTFNSKKPICIDSPNLEISSTEIRNKIKIGHSIKYLIPKDVLNYIFSNKIYF